MNKDNLIDEMYHDLKKKYTKEQINDILISTINTMKKVFKRGDFITFTGFGRFSVKDIKPTVKVNPQNLKEKLNIPGYRKPYFSASPLLKKEMNEVEE